MQERAARNAAARIEYSSGGSTAAAGVLERRVYWSGEIRVLKPLESNTELARVEYQPDEGRVL